MMWHEEDNGGPLRPPFKREAGRLPLVFRIAQ
ncbi:hypothetical protein DZA65_04013 [Dickeya dianthicola]|nr:hypothetical protein DZA65_04013 [Dickeya dianthicola]